MNVVSVVPAHQEEKTVGLVIDALRDSRVFQRIILVDDGSTDGTAEKARLAGAEVIQMPKNAGKGQAMRAGVSAAPEADVVAFFDADLIGLKPEHVQRMASFSRAGYDMVCGVRDYGIFNAFHAVAPLITGQRFVSRKVLNAVPADCWKGYAIETAMNHAATAVGARTVLLVLPRVWSRQKASKVGFVAGYVNELKMLATIGNVQSRLDCDGTCEP